MKIQLILCVLAIIISLGIINILCFLIGAKTGQMVLKNKDIKILSVPNPIKKVKEYRQYQDEQSYQENVKNMWDNINSYDGTGLGQKDIN